MVRAVVAVVLVMLACGACSEDPQPVRADPSPSATVVTATPTISGSPTPVAVLDPEQTVNAWVQARNAALVAGDVRPVTALAADSCTTCTASIEPIQRVYAAGGRYETPGWSVVSSRLFSMSNGQAKVRAAVEYAAGQTFANASATPIVYDLERHIVEFRLVRVSGEWRLSFIGYFS